MPNTKTEANREIQKNALTVLEELDRICKKNNLRYFLTAGTLLGAVRHSGFIPWDDDVDVAMPVKDYKKLRKIIKKELGENFFFQDDKAEKDYTFFFAKIRLNGSLVYEENLKDADIHKGVYVDIFPLDKCPRNDRIAKAYFKSIQVISCALLSKINPDFVCEYKKTSAKLIFKALRVLPIGILKGLRRITNACYTVAASKDRLCTVSGAHGYPYETYRSSWFSDEEYLTFEGRSYPAPIGWRELLTNMYGDYMTLPPEDEQKGHFIYNNNTKESDGI